MYFVTQTLYNVILRQTAQPTQRTRIDLHHALFKSVHNYLYRSDENCPALTYFVALPIYGFIGFVFPGALQEKATVYSLILRLKNTVPTLDIIRSLLEDKIGER